MKITMFFVCTLIFNTMSCMSNQEDMLIAKLKLVLTAGRYVYSEHKCIHADATQRASEIIKLFNINDELLLADRVNTYCIFIGRVLAMYQKYAKHPDPQVMEVLEQTHRSCLKWALTIPSGKRINRYAWKEFRQAFIEKKKIAHLAFCKADTAYNEFSLGHDLSKDLTKEQAVLAWQVILPDPVLSQV